MTSQTSSPKRRFAWARRSRQEVVMGCFAFVDTWLAKRRQHRKEKKKRAISARSHVSKTGDKTSLKVSKGGIAFDLVLENRVPTPFRGLTPRPASRPHLSGMDKKKAFEATTARRQEMLDRRSKFARDSNRKRENCKRVYSDAMLSPAIIYAGWDSTFGEEECLTGANSPCQ